MSKSVAGIGEEESSLQLKYVLGEEKTSPLR